MKARDAIGIAKRYLSEVFDEENILNLGLEEIEYDEAQKTWNVTLGFSRPWNQQRNVLSALVQDEHSSLRRDYRVVRVRESDGEVTSIKLREMAA